MTETKPFYKTSEFWMTMATQLLIAVGELSNYLPVDYGIPIHAVSTGLYAVARGNAKSGVSPNPTVTVVEPVVPVAPPPVVVKP